MIRAPKIKVAKFIPSSERYRQSRAYCVVFLGPNGRSEPSAPSKIVEVDSSRLGLVTLYNLPQDRKHYEFIEVYRTTSDYDGCQLRIVATLKMGTRRWVDRSFAAGKSLSELADTAPIPASIAPMSRLALLVTKAAAPYGMTLVRPPEFRFVSGHRMNGKKPAKDSWSVRFDFRVQGPSQLIPSMEIYVSCGPDKRVRNPEQFAKRVVSQTLEMLAQFIKIEAAGVRK